MNTLVLGIMANTSSCPTAADSIVLAALQGGGGIQDLGRLRGRGYLKQIRSHGGNMECGGDWVECMPEGVMVLLGTDVFGVSRCSTQHEI